MSFWHADGPGKRPLAAAAAVVLLASAFVVGGTIEQAAAAAFPDAQEAFHPHVSGATQLTLTASDADGDAVTFDIPFGPPWSGTLGAISAPICAGTTCTANVTYTPNAGFVGPDSFYFGVTDPDAQTDWALVSLTVGNTPPTMGTQNSITTSGPVKVTLSGARCRRRHVDVRRVDRSPARIAGVAKRAGLHHEQLRQLHVVHDDRDLHADRGLQRHRHVLRSRRTTAR